MKARIWLKSDTDQSELLGFPAGQVAVFSRCCPGENRTNEDGALIASVDETRIVLAVADGCGGMQAGAEAARITLRALQRAISRHTGESGSLRSAILDGIEAANSRILKLGVGAATTLAVAEIDGDKIRTFHIGDSQVLLVGNRGKLKLATPAHSPVGYALEAGLLSPAEAIDHEDRHIVSNVVGSSDCHIEVGMRHRAAKRDTLILATDGIFDNLHLDEVSDIVRRGELHDAASRLANRTMDRIESESAEMPSKPDDATFVVFRWQ